MKVIGYGNYSHIVEISDSELEEIVGRTVRSSYSGQRYDVGSVIDVNAKLVGLRKLEQNSANVVSAAKSLRTLAGTLDDLLQPMVQRAIAPPSEPDTEGVQTA